MKTKKIKNLENAQIKNGAIANNCCGGVPVWDKVACCQLDENSKAAGERGCNCSSATNKSGSGCC